MCTLYSSGWGGRQQNSKSSFYQPESSGELGTSLELAVGLDCWCRCHLNSVHLLNEGKHAVKAIYKVLNNAKLHMMFFCTLDGLVVLFRLLGLDWSTDLESMCGGSVCAGSWD